jgi:endonuclease III
LKIATPRNRSVTAQGRLPVTSSRGGVRGPQRAFCARWGGGVAPRIHKVMQSLARAIEGLELPAVEKIAEGRQENPFDVLIATLLSARTQDATTLAASTRLFRAARTPRTMAALTPRQIEKLIYPVSFYRHKARHVIATCRLLVDKYKGRVPSTMEELLTLPGVGRKTANLVLILGFKSSKNICVDTHVHRISNRLGWVNTTTPEETEQALYSVTEERWWPYINLYLVTWGQNVCRPVHPRCGTCLIRRYCGRVGVSRVSGSVVTTPASSG